MTPTPTRIAMWSGPRNISTAMMRAFENRGDCAVGMQLIPCRILECKRSCRSRNKTPRTDIPCKDKIVGNLLSFQVNIRID